MGAVQSDTADFPRLEPSEHFFALFFQHPDKIKIILAHSDTIEIIRSACLSASPDCVQDCHQVEDGSYRIKFRGSPFSAGSSFDTAVLAKTVAMNILADLYAVGWDFLLASDLSRSVNLSTWFFRRVTNTRREIPSMFCLSLSSTDTLQLIHRGDGPNASARINEILKRAVIKSVGYYGIQAVQAIGMCYEIKLSGNPWRSSSLERGVESRKMLLDIMRQFYAGSYQLYATANLKDTADCLFFTHHRPSTIGTMTAAMQDKLCMISLDDNDQLRLIDCPSVVVDVTRQMIADRRSWPAGLRNETDLGRGGVLDDDGERWYTWSFQMQGSPWWATESETVYSRLFLTDLFDTLLELGWCLHASLDISINLNDKSVFILRSCQPTRLSHFCVSLNEADKGAAGGGQDTATSMKNLLRHAISASWPPGIQGESGYYDSYEFELKGNPWHVGYLSTARCFARAMMCRVLAELTASGCRVICSADVSAKCCQTKDIYRIDVHSWFVVRNASSLTEAPHETSVEVGAASAPLIPPNFDFDEPPPSYDDVVGASVDRSALI